MNTRARPGATILRALALVVVGGLATAGACDGGLAEGDRTVVGATGEVVSARYDADSAARGLLSPAMAGLLEVEPLLAGMADTSRAEGRRCKQDTLAQRRDVSLRFDRSHADTVTTVFARRTPEGELRRAEVLRRHPDRTALAATWDADTKTTMISEFSGGTVRKTTSKDDDAPLARALRYVGRRTLATPCGGG